MRHNFDDLVAESLADWCKRYPVKELAHMVDVKPQTIVSWRSGNLPQMRHFIRMVDIFGVEFIDHTLGPVIGFGQVGVRERFIRAVDELQIIAKHIAKSPGMTLMIIAVICSFSPASADLVRTPRPPNVRTSRTKD